MKNITFKIFNVVLIIFAILGQGFSYASMSCDMTHTNDHEMNLTAQSLDLNNMDHMKMDHKNMNHADMAHEDSNDEQSNTFTLHESMSNMDDMNCCGLECVCPASGCTSAFFISALPNVFKSNSPDKLLLNLPYIPTQEINSLFRPPILS